jgi:hypothetical protein
MALGSFVFRALGGGGVVGVVVGMMSAVFLGTAIGTASAIAAGIIVGTSLAIALMPGVVMASMPIALGILLSRFHAGSAVTNGSPRISLTTFVNVRDARTGSGKPTTQLDESSVVVYR